MPCTAWLFTKSSDSLLAFHITIL